MPGDGVVSIGATFDKTNVDAGLGETQELVKASMDAVAASIVEANAKSKAAWKGLGDEVKNAAAIHNAEALKVAEATRVVTAAQADLRRATVLSKDAKIDDAQRTAVLASAQTNLAAKSAELAAAKRAEAAAIAEAAEEEALSSNFVVRAFQRAGIEIRESLELVQEKMIETAETGGLEAEGISAGFGGLSKLLGAGIAVGFAANYIDGLAKINVELDHLATKTGISITMLAGLQQIMKEAGGDFEAVATGLVRMESNVQKLSEGGAKGLAEAFTNLGLKIEDVRRAKPEELLQMVATAMAREADANIRANSAITIFGRGGQALIPVLREQGALLTENMQRQGALTGVTEQSAEAARRWTQDVARLSSQFRSVMMPVMEHAEDVVRGMAGAFETAAAIIITAFEGVATAIVSVLAPLYRYGVLLKDVMTGNWTELKSDVEAASHAFTDTWKAGFGEIKASWAEVHRTFTEQSELPPTPKDGGDEDGAAGGLNSSEAIKEYTAELNALKIEHQMSTADEIAFWKKKLAAAKKGSDEYVALQAKLAPLMQEMRKGASGAEIKQATEALNQLKTNHLVSLREEIDFWQSRLAVAREGSSEYAAIEAKLAPLMQQQEKKDAADKDPETQEQLKRQERGLVQASEDFIEQLKKEAKAAEEAAKQELEAYRGGAEEKIRIAHEDYVDVEKNANFEVEMGRMTAARRLAVLREAAAQESQIRQQQSKFIEMLDMNEQNRYAADLRKEEQDTREFARQIAQLNQQAALQVQKYWKAGFNVINQDLTQLLNDYLKGTKNMEQVFARMFQGIIEKAADWVLEMLLKHAEMWAELQIQQMLGLTKQKTTQAASNIATVTGDAGVAAAGAMAYYSATDPVAAPILAASQFAMTMAYGSGGLFDVGGMMPHGGFGVNLSGAPERVLSPSQTSNFERMVNQSSSSKNVTNHLHYEPKVNGSSRAQMRADLRSHADDIHQIVREGYRSGALSG